MNESVHELRYRQKTSRLLYNTKVICCTVLMLNTTYLGCIEIEATLQCTPNIFNEPILVIVLINPKGACKLEDLRDNFVWASSPGLVQCLWSAPDAQARYSTLGRYILYGYVVRQLHRLPRQPLIRITKFQHELYCDAASRAEL